MGINQKGIGRMPLMWRLLCVGALALMTGVSGCQKQQNYEGHCLFWGEVDDYRIFIVWVRDQSSGEPMWGLAYLTEGPYDVQIDSDRHLYVDGTERPWPEPDGALWTVGPTGKLWRAPVTIHDFMKEYNAIVHEGNGDYKAFFTESRIRDLQPWLSDEIGGDGDD